MPLKKDREFISTAASLLTGGFQKMKTIFTKVAVANRWSFAMGIIITTHKNVRNGQKTRYRFGDTKVV